MSKYISKYAPHQTLKIPNLEQYAPIFPKGTGTGPIPKRVREKSLSHFVGFVMSRLI